MKFKKLITARDFAQMSPERRAEVIANHADYALTNDVHLWAKEHSAEWEQARNLVNGLGPSHDQNLQKFKDLLNGPPHQSFTEADQRLLNEQPFEETKPYYVPANVGECEQYDLTKLKKENPAKAYRVQRAAFLYGISTREPVKPEEPKPMPEVPFRFSDESCTTFGLPQGTVGTMTEFLRYSEVAARIKAEQAK